MEAQDELGPIDVVVIGYAPDAPKTGEAVPALLDLVDRGIIRVFDVVIITKNDDGTFTIVDIAGLDEEGFGDLSVFVGAATGLLSDDDAALAAEQLEPGATGVVIVYENRWAGPFAAAVRRNGGRLIANERIHVQDLLAALDAAEATA